jgi:hypothetical protein
LPSFTPNLKMSFFLFLCDFWSLFWLSIFLGLILADELLFVVCKNYLDIVHFILFIAFCL